MTITASNIKLLASQRMTDTEDGGGQMTGTGLQDGVDNNIFQDIASTDRAFGRLSLMKVWPAVQSADTDTLLGAHVIIDDTPDDANVRGWAMLGNSASESRANVLSRLQVSHWEPRGPQGNGIIQWTGPSEITVGAGFSLSPGMVIYSLADAGGYVDPVVLLTTVNTSGNVWSVTYEGVRGSVALAAAGYAAVGVPSTIGPRVVTTRPVTGTLSSGATYCDVDTLLAQIVPKQPGVAPGAAVQIGIDGAAVTPGGVAAAFRSGDGLVVHHTGEVTAATYANGNTVNVGRTGIANFRLIGADGRSIPAGWTGDLATGVVTVNDISGWSQPVKVRHTIEEVLACSRTGYPEVSGGSGGSGTSEATVPFALSAGLTMYCGRPNVGSIRVISRTGQDITDSTFVFSGTTFRLFTVNLGAGTAAFSGSTEPGVTAAIASHSPVTLVSSGTYSTPGSATAPQATLNRITFNRPLTKAFPAGTLVSSMLFLGDLRARVGAAFSQESWGSVWADSRIGSAIIPQYQQGLNPIVVTNQGAVSERWAFIFTSSTQFRLVGETLGQIATGDVNSTFAPVNPATGAPYFTIAATGWGAWAAGNVLRLNTYGANAPVWAARAVLPSAPSDTPDSLTLAVRGDIDA